MTARRRTADEMEEIVERLLSTPREALDVLLAAADLALAELDRSADDVAAYQTYFHRLRDFLEREGGNGADLKRLGAPEIAGAIAEGRDAVVAKLDELGLRSP